MVSLFFCRDSKNMLLAYYLNMHILRMCFSSPYSFRNKNYNPNQVLLLFPVCYAHTYHLQVLSYGMFHFHAFTLNVSEARM